MVGKSVLTEIILQPSFLRVVCKWMLLITGVQLMSHNSLSFSDLVAFVHISPPCLPWAADLNYHCWQTSPLFSHEFFLPVLRGEKKKKKKAANHLLPALIASWLHSLFWLKVQLLHGWFLPRNCRTIARSSIFCIRGVTNQEETSDAVKHCLWGKNLLEVLYVWALMGLISLPVRWGLYFVGVLVMHYCVIFKSSLLCNQRVGCKSLYFMWRHLLFRWVRHTEEWWVISHE